jgi:hypothetical protein
MDFDKLTAAMTGGELPKLMTRRSELRTELDTLNEQQGQLLGELSLVEAEIGKTLGVDAEPPRSRVMTCSKCQQQGHTKRTCPK